MTWIPIFSYILHLIFIFNFPLMLEPSRRYFLYVSRIRPCRVTYPSAKNFRASTVMRIIEPEFPQTRTIYGSNGPERWKFSRLLIFSVCGTGAGARARNPTSKGIREKGERRKKIIIKIYWSKIVSWKKVKSAITQPCSGYVPIYSHFWRRIDDDTLVTIYSISTNEFF